MIKIYLSGAISNKDIKVLCDCNILINIKNNGWEKSKGAMLERKIAKVLFIDIRYKTI